MADNSPFNTPQGASVALPSPTPLSLLEYEPGRVRRLKETARTSLEDWMLQLALSATPLIRPSISVASIAPGAGQLPWPVDATIPTYYCTNDTGESLHCMRYDKDDDLTEDR